MRDVSANNVMKMSSKIIVSTLLSPLTLLAMSILGGLTADITNWSNLFTNFFMYVYPVGLIVVILFGIPSYFILKHFGYLNYIILASLGFLGGAAFGTLATPILYSMLFYGWCGFLVSSGFWLFLYTFKVFNEQSTNE